MTKFRNTYCISYIIFYALENGKLYIIQNTKINLITKFC